MTSCSSPQNIGYKASGIASGEFSAQTAGTCLSYGESNTNPERGSGDVRLECVGCVFEGA